MPSYFLAIDVGNTATSFGLFSLPSKIKNPHPSHVWTLSTPHIKQASTLIPFLKTNLRKASIPLEAIQGGMVSSVVPPVDAALKRHLRQLFKKNFQFVSGTMRSRVKVRYKSPGEVGADRIVNARAAMALWKGPSIVVDFGTATTFDCVTAGGAYIGGVIAPGPVISAEALYNRTARLPMVLLEKPVSILGRNTLESMQAGLYHGYRGLVQEIVTHLRKKLQGRVRVMATGGQARWILKGVRGVDSFVPHLTLLGLFHLWNDTQVM